MKTTTTNPEAIMSIPTAKLELLTATPTAKLRRERAAAAKALAAAEPHEATNTRARLVCRANRETITQIDAVLAAR